MANLTHSHSLTDFQRNARSFIEGINESKEPLLLTVNGKVQAVVVDPTTFQQMEALQEKERFLSALREGLSDFERSATRPIENVLEDMRKKYGL